jgi:hypothetical protein
VAATPAGWELIIVGLTVAAAGTAAAGVDQLVHKRGGAWYDDIMKWLGSL